MKKESVSFSFGLISLVLWIEMKGKALQNKAVWIDVKEQYYVLFGTHIAPFFSFLHLEILNRNTSFFH